MISTWYFCSCVETPPKVTQAFLTAIEALRSHRSDDDLVRISLNEILKAEQIMRQYAVPEVIASSLRESLSAPDVIAAHRDVLVDAFEVLDTRVAENLLAAWNALRDQDTSRTADGVLIPLREALSRSVALRPSSLRAEPAPYLHTSEFLAETAILKLMVHAVRINAELLHRLADDDDFVLLVNDALLSRFGRLALLLAVEAATALGEEVVPSGLLRRRLLEAPNTAALWEPDVLGSLARLLFTHPGAAAPARTLQQTRERLLQETVTFARLNDLGSTVVAPAADQQAIGRLGLVGAPNEQIALVLWQAVMWDIAAELDPAGTAEQLQHDWIAPNRPITTPVRVTLPMSNKGFRTWSRRAAALASLRAEGGGGIRFEPRSGQFHRSSWLSVAMLSPWMTRENKADAPSSPFPRITDGLVLLRLLLAAVTAGALLRQPSPGPRAHLISLTLHVGDVLADRTHARYLDGLWFETSTGTDTESMSGPLSGLALYVRRLIRRLGIGAHHEVDPAWYADYLSQEPGPTTPEQERRLRDGPAQQVAWPWIQDALSGSLPDATELQGRWRRTHQGDGRGYAQQTLRYMVDHAADTAVYKPAGLLKVHFEEDADRARRLSWHRASRRNRLDMWKILSAEAIPAQAWARLRPAVTPGSEAELAMASVRLAAVMAQNGANQPEYSTWVSEWRELISRVDEPKYFPRALRIFLLHLLELPLTGAGVESQLLEELVDAEIEFGFGTPLDRSMLFTRLGSTSSLADELAQALRLRMLRGVYRRAALPTRSNRILDPWKSREDSQSDALLGRLLELFVYDLGGHRTRVQTTTVSELVPRMWRDAHRPPFLREVRVDLDTAAPGTGRSVADPRLVMGVTVDPTTDMARLHLAREPRTSGAVDAFTSSPDELRERLQQRSPVTAVGVIGAVESPYAWVNVGLEEPVRTELPDDAGVGDVVVVHLQEGAHGPMAVPGRPACRPDTAPVVGDLRRTQVRVTEHDGVPVVTIEPEGEVATVLGAGVHSEQYRRLWTPDLTGLMTASGRSEPAHFESYARWSGREWLPVDQGFAEFLAVLSASAQEDGGQRPVRIVVVDVLGETAARYSTAPGSNVVIPHSAWDDTSRDLVLAEFAKAGLQATGMVIDAAVRRVEERGPVLVLRSSESAPDQPPAFDRRAESWRTLFQEEDNHEAHWAPARNRFEYDTHIPEFPVVHVDVNSTGQRCRFTAIRWGVAEQWGARVVGTPVQERNLTPGARSRKAFDSIVNLQLGTALTLSAALSTPLFGMLRGWTSTGLPVDIEPESLTFTDLAGSWNEQGRGAALIRRREVEISATPKLLAPRNPQRPRGVADAHLLAAVEDATDRAAAEDHLLRARHLNGIVISEPRNNSHDAGDVMRAWLDLGGTIAECPLRRDQFDNSAVGVGAIVTAERNAGGDWEFRARTRRIQVRARWRLQEKEPPDSAAVLFLGTVHWKGARSAVAQARNHPDLYVYPAADTDPGHLAERFPRRDRPGQQSDGRAQGRHRERQPGRRVGWRNARLAWDRAAIEFTRSTSDRRTRVVVRVPGTATERVYPGVIARASADLDVAVAGVELQLDQVSPQHVVAQRIFRLTRAAPVPDTVAGPDESDGFRTYMAGERRPLSADLRDRQVRLRVPWKVPVGGGWTSTLPLAEGDEPWVEATYSAQDTRVVLEERDGRLVASYRNVPPLGLEEAVPFLQRQGLVPGVMSLLRQPLRYIERRQVVSQVVHRFEWGYGWTLSVPEDRLRVSGRMAGSWPITPFHGDAISQIRVDPLPDGRYSLDIGQLGIDIGWRSQFFHDSVAGLVTTAEIDTTPGSAGRIRALQARWRRAPGTEDTAYRDDRRIAVQSARLHPDASRAVQEAMAADNASDGSRRAFVRLRLEDFRRSGGNLMQFDFVRPVLGTDDGLQRNMFVFLEAQTIEELPNDVRLQLRPGTLLGEAGEGFTVHVRRREFSVRQDLLRQIHHSGERLQGDVYLVRLQDIARDGRTAEGQIRQSLPRPSRVLRSFLSSGRSVLGVVVRRPRGYTLELRPNVLFHLAPDEIDAPEGLARGTFVRVSSRDARITLVPTLPGDHDYLPADGRPAILLPMQNLLGRKDTLDEALASGTYTVAGLPSVTLPAIQAATGPTPFAQRLITREHPKIAQVVRLPDSRADHIAPLGDMAIAGTLDLRPDRTAHLRIGGGEQSERIPWSRISFLDDGRAAIHDRCTGTWWQYHDVTTARRHPRPPHWPSTPQALPERATVTTEPVFFSPRWSLRHPTEQLRRFGFPATELVEGAHGRGETKNLNLPVAGVATSANGGARGLWVEIAPGRVIEIVGSMMTTADSARTWLDRVDWSHFSPGDLVDLNVQRGHRLEIGSLALRWWRPGPRGGLASRALLPVGSVDTRRGAVVLGHGHTTLKYPIEPDRPAPRPGSLVWLGADNSVEAADRPQVVAGDVVLVQHVQGRLQVVGAPWFDCEVPETPDEPWTQSALRDKTVADLIGLCGGSMPVTVEGVTGQRLRVSRRLQRDGDLPIRKFVPGLPLGRLGQYVVFRSGARLHRCRSSDLVPGMPAAQLGPAIDALRSIQTIYWLRGLPGQTVGVGLPTERSAGAAGETRVRVIGAIGDGADLGLLVWEPDERRPRWLPANQTGWLPPTRDELTAAFRGTTARGAGSWLEQRPDVNVSLRPDGSVSIIQTAANRQRLQQLKVGDTLRVEVVRAEGTPAGAGRIAYLARVYLSDVLVQLQTDETVPLPQPGRPRWCELEVKKRNAQITTVEVCDLGIRQVRMAIPDWAGRGTVGSLVLPPPAVEAVRADLDSRVVTAADAVAANRSTVIDALEDIRLWLEALGPQLFGLEPDASLDLVPALSIGTLLAALGSAGNIAAAAAAVHVARQIGLMATTSRHLEPMLRLWTTAESRATQRDMWRRLDKLPLATTIEATTVDRIRAVDDAIRNRAALRRSPDVILASACVAAAVGAHTSYDEIHQAPTILSELAALARALVPRPSALLAQAALLPQQAEFLGNLRRRAQVTPRITLLPVPAFLQDPRCADARLLLEGLA